MSDRRQALVTGSSTGIGRAVVLDLLAAGWRVFGTVRRDEHADALHEAAGARAEALTAVRMDVTDDASVAEGMAQVAAGLDGAPLHGVVQNAGTAFIGPLEIMPIAYFEQQLNVNLTGVLRVTQAALPLMRQGEAPRGSRRMVMISSISGRVGTPLAGAYNASKFALEGMSDALRRELMPQGIDVLLIEPGAIRTAIWQTSRERALGRLPAFSQHEAMPHYQGFLDAAIAKVDHIEEGGLPPASCAEVVRHALTTKSPAVRHLVGKDAKVGARLQRFLPTRWFDKLLVKDALRMPRDHDASGR